MSGTAYSSTSVPPRIDDPPQGYLDDADGRDSGEANAYTGLDDYQLKDGVKDDDKKRWAATDFVRWLAQGATLEATGQVHDSHEASTSQVSSSAWGAEYVDAEVTKEEGDVGEISAENRILFSYNYTVSGPRILDAKILLSGSCVDIQGKLHKFSLSDVRSESVTEHQGVQRMHVRRSKGSAKISAGAQARSGSTGPSGSAGWNGSFEAIEETEDGATINTSIDRALPGAGGLTDSEKSVDVEDSVSGNTVLKKSYSVFSQGSVTLAARGSTGKTTVVLLQSFKIENSLKVFKKAVKLKEPTDTEPPPSGGTGTPAEEEGGAGGGCDDSPVDDAGGEASGGEASGQDSSAEAECSNDRPEACLLDLDGIEGLDGMQLRISALAPIGLADEPGHVTGELHLVLNDPAPRDLVFSVLADPPGSVVLLQGATLTIPEGSRLGGGALDGLDSGLAGISVHLLDTEGTLSGREAVVPVGAVSTAELATPRIYARERGNAWHAGKAVTVFALRGQPVPELLIGRTGFAGYETTATSVTIIPHDPQGILPPLPSAITIPEGDAETGIELLVRDVEGTARLTMRAGDSEFDVYVVSRSQGWESLPVIRIPVGATAVVPFELRWPERAPRTVSVLSSDSLIAQPVAGAEMIQLVDGVTLGAAVVRGEQEGRTEIRYESEGLPTLVAAVEVVPARVRVTGEFVEVSNLPAGTEGTISLALPDGLEFAELALPPEFASFLTVSGVGTDRLVLRFTPSPDLPALLRLGVRIDGAELDDTELDDTELDDTELGGIGSGGMSHTEAPNTVPIDIDETLREDVTMPVRNTYRVELGS